jgi:hypothetical protein
MTLREALGADVQRIYEQVEALLDREDGVVALFDGGRVLTYAQGFGASASQLEFLGVELERALHSVVGRRASNKGRMHRERNEGDRHGRDVDGDCHGPAHGVLQLADKVA